MPFRRQRVLLSFSSFRPPHRYYFKKETSHDMPKWIAAASLSSKHLGSRGSERVTAQLYTTQFANSLRWFPKRNSGKGKGSRQFARNPRDRVESGLEASIGLLLSGDNWLMLRNDHGGPMRSTVRRPTARDSEITQARSAGNNWLLATIVNEEP